MRTSAVLVALLLALIVALVVQVIFDSDIAAAACIPLTLAVLATGYKFAGSV